VPAPPDEARSLQNARRSWRYGRRHAAESDHNVNIGTRRLAGW